MPGDLDSDGDIDYVVGNFGWNSQIKASQKEPVTLYTKDFDNNGQIDPILCYYLDGESYPAFSKDDLEGQLPMIKRKYVNYADYADQKITDIFTPEELEAASVLTATELSTGYFENQGDGSFKFNPLPIEAQMSPVYGILVTDVDGDNVTDLVLGGNFKGSRVKFGEYDANYGTVLKGDGKGGFIAMSEKESGIMVRGEVRDIIQLKTSTGDTWLLWARNNDQMAVYKMNGPDI
jgi:hypothetical protein